MKAAFKVLMAMQPSPVAQAYPDLASLQTRRANPTHETARDRLMAQLWQVANVIVIVLELAIRLGYTPRQDTLLDDLKDRFQRERFLNAWWVMVMNRDATRQGQACSEAHDIVGISDNSHAILAQPSRSNSKVASGKPFGCLSSINLVMPHLQSGNSYVTPIDVLRNLAHSASDRVAIPPELHITHRGLLDLYQRYKDSMDPDHDVDDMDLRIPESDDDAEEKPFDPTPDLGTGIKVQRPPDNMTASGHLEYVNTLLSGADGIEKASNARVQSLLKRKPTPETDQAILETLRHSHTAKRAAKHLCDSRKRLRDEGNRVLSTNPGLARQLLQQSGRDSRKRIATVVTIQPVSAEDLGF